MLRHETYADISIFNPSKDRQIQFWLPSKITSDGRFETSPNHPTEDSFSWTENQFDAKLEMIDDKKMLHFSNIGILNDIPPEILNQNDETSVSISNLTSEPQMDMSGDEVEEPKYEEKVEIIQQSAADDQENDCMNLENQSVMSNDQKSSDPASSEPKITEISNIKSSQSGTISRTIMHKHPKASFQIEVNLLSENFQNSAIGLTNL